MWNTESSPVIEASEETPHGQGCKYISLFDNIHAVITRQGHRKDHCDLNAVTTWITVADQWWIRSFVRKALLPVGADCKHRPLSYPNRTKVQTYDVTTHVNYSLFHYDFTTS